MVFGDLAFNPHKEYGIDSIYILIDIDYIAIITMNVIGYGSNNSLLIWAVHNQCDSFHGVFFYKNIGSHAIGKLNGFIYSILSKKTLRAYQELSGETKQLCFNFF